MKNLWKKTALLMSVVVFIVAISRPALCAASSVSDAEKQAYLNTEEINMLEAKAMQNPDLMNIESGGDSTVTFLEIMGFAACVLIVLSIFINDDDSTDENK